MSKRSEARVTPHVGVWIETDRVVRLITEVSVTPHVGVWIETLISMPMHVHYSVTPHVGVWIETNVQATPVGPLNLRYRRYFQSSSFKKETNSGEFRSFGSKVIVCIGKGFTGGFIIPVTTPDIKIYRFATQRKVLNYFFIYKTTGNDSTALVIKTFHIILLIKPNFDF